jgi:hypothetical protein
MMHDDNDAIELLLLDLHLNQLEPSEAARVQQEVAGSPELRAKSQALGDLLGLLDRYQVPDAPDHLADCVMEHIDRQAGLIPFPPAAAALSAEVDPRPAANPVLSLREVIAIAACITLFMGVFVPGYFKAQNIAHRNLCRDNLRQIWGGLAAYAQDHSGYVSYAGYTPGGSWLPTRVPNVPRASNSQPLFTLLRLEYVRDPRIFICPTMRHSRPMLADNYRQFTDFAEPANISYSFQYMNLPRGRRMAEMHGLMALVADRNPFIEQRLAHPISPYDDRAGNSLTHEDGAGQNVVYVSGQGGWFTQPNIGVNQDHIYRAGRIIRYQGIEEPVCETDSFLVN